MYAKDAWYLVALLSYFIFLIYLFIYVLTTLSIYLVIQLSLRNELEITWRKFVS